MAKELQKKGAPVYDEIVAHFGEEILDEKGEINRSKLADIVFTDEKELKILNGIVHPADTLSHKSDDFCAHLFSHRHTRIHHRFLHNCLL